MADHDLAPHLSRRQFLALTSVLLDAEFRPLRALAADECLQSSREDLSGYLNGASGFVKEVVRPNDLLAATLAFIELEIQFNNPSPPTFWRPPNANPNQQSLIVFHLPPQHIGERVYGKSLVNDCPDANPNTLNPGIPATRRLSGSSRISFRFQPENLDPGTVSIPLDLTAILQACEKFDQAVWITGDPNHTKPSLFETSLEIPYRLIIGPNASGIWDLAFSEPDVLDVDPCQHHKTTQSPSKAAFRWHELWTASYRVGDSQPLFRAITARKTDKWNNPDDDAIANPITALCVTPLTHSDREQLADKMNGVATSAATPANLATADRFMLTSLGGFVDIHYKDHAPLDNNAKKDNIREWKHGTSQGRDERVVITRTYYAHPYRHKCSTVETTERVFDERGVAYLKRHLNMRVDEPTRTFSEADARRLGFQSVTLQLGSSGLSPDLVLIDITLKNLPESGLTGDQKAPDIVIPALPSPDASHPIEYEIQLIKTDMSGNVLPPVKAALVLANETMALRIRSKSDMQNAVDAINAVVSRQIGKLDTIANDLDSKVFDVVTSAINAPPSLKIGDTIHVGEIVDLGGLRLRCITPGIIQALPDVAAAEAYDVLRAGDASEAELEILPSMAQAAFRRQVTLAEVDVKNEASHLATLFTQSAAFRAGVGDFKAITTDYSAWFQPKLEYARVRIDDLAAIAGKAELLRIGLTEDYIANKQTESGVFAVAKNRVETQLNGEAAQAQQQALASIRSGIRSLSSKAGPILGTLVSDVTQDIHKFDPVAAFKDFFSGLQPPKLFGFVDLGTLFHPLDDIVDLSSSAQTKIDQIPNLRATLENGRLITRFRYDKDLRPTDLLKSIENKQLHLTFQMEYSIRPDGSDPQRKVDVSIANVLIPLLSGSDALHFINLSFARVNFTSVSGSPLEVHVEGMNAAIESKSALAFLQKLEQALNPGGSLPKISMESGYVRALYSLHFPDLPLGAFTISNLHFDLGADLPIAEKDLRFVFSLADPIHTFNIAFGIFGGGGYFSLAFSGLSRPEIAGALDLSVSAELDLAVAHGSISVAAGLAYAFEGGNYQLAGFISACAEASVLDLITASLTFYAEFRYDSKSGFCAGKAITIVSISIAFFSIDVPVLLEFRFRVSDPNGRTAAVTGCEVPQEPMTFSQQYPTEPFQPVSPEWATYCGAFA